MAVTKIGDIINPQVMADIIEAKIEAQAKLTPYAKLDTTLEGVPGNTVTVPSWNYIGDAEDFNVETASDTDAEMSVSKLTAGSTTFTVKCAGKSVGILQTAINSGLGDPVGQANVQLAKAIASKVDNDVIACAYTATNIYDGTSAKIGYTGFVTAVTKFEDEEDGVDKVCFIHPGQEVSLLTDSQFISADKFEAGVAVNGAIGKIAGCWIKKSKKVLYRGYEKDNSDGTITIVSDATTETATKWHLAHAQSMCADTLAVGDKIKALSAPYYMNPIIKLEADSADTDYTEDELPALTIYLKKDTQVDHEYFPKKQRHDITATKYYGVAKTNDAKLILAKFLGETRTSM